MEDAGAWEEFLPTQEWRSGMDSRLHGNDILIELQIMNYEL